MPAFVEVGTEVAGYRVASFIGRGGMAVVYRAEDMRLGRNVALKLLAPELSQNERFQQRFMRESRMAASIDHPNIIPIYEAGEVGGLLYIVMRYVEGSDLKVIIEREGPLELGRLFQLMRQVGGALDAAHAGGLVHRDVKPGNILIASGSGPESEDHAYLTDFGLTKRSSSLSGLTATGHFLGTIDYVAPEQITGNPVDARTDVYALGCVLYESLTGVVPYQRDDDAALLWAHLVEAPPSVREHRPDVPDGLDAVIATAMAKAPADRYASCRELTSALQAALGLSGGSSVAYAPGQAPAEEYRADDPPADEAADPEPSAAEWPPAQERRPSEQAWQPPAREPEPGPDPEPEPAWAPGVPAKRSKRPKRPSGRSRGRGRLIALITAVVVVLAAIPAVLLFRANSGDRLTETVSRDELVPLSFKHPGSWRRQEAGINVVFSPAEGAMTTLFSQKGTGDSWGQVREVIGGDGDKAIGLATSFSSTLVDVSTPEQLKASLEGLLPANATFSSGPQQLLVGGYAADQVEGDLTDPSDPGTKLHFQAVVVQVQRPDPRTVYLVFFAPQSSFESKRPLFEQVQASANFLA
jgi:serine/threonine protein kinase